MKNNIVLIGFMGSGKSCVSKLLAAKLGMRLLDTDVQLETEQKQTVAAIFAEQGEAGFRRMETALLTRLADGAEPLVISTGGGLAVQPQNRGPLKALGTVVYLKVQPDTVLTRLAGDETRPLLAGSDKEEKVRALLAQREPHYMASADICIETDALTPEEIADRIILEKGGRER